MLFHTLAAPGSGMYVEQYSCVITGALRADRFKAAWNAALTRHPALRTAFLWEDLDEPLQVVRERVDLSWTMHDWRDASSAVQAERWAALRHEDRARGFDLVRAPLTRMALIQLAADTHRFMWTFHHMLLDGWSAMTVLREVWTDYAARCDGQPAELASPRPFRDYVAWHRARDLEADEAYWTDRLQGFQTPTPLHIDTTSHAETPRTETPPAAPSSRAERSLTLSADATAAAHDYARGHRITLNTLVQGAWTQLLSRYSGEDDVVYGTTVAGRPPTLNGVESMVGAFINTVPMRVLAAPNRKPIDWLQEVQSALMDARTHAYAPLSKIQQWSPSPDGRGLFHSLLVFENHPPARDHPAENAGLRVNEAAFQGQSNYPLALLVLPGERLQFTAVYDASRFPGPRIKRMLDHLVTLIQGFVTGHADPLTACPMLSGPERRPLQSDFQGHDTPLDDVHARPAHQNIPADPDDTSTLGIHHLIEQAAQTSPQANAVCFEDEPLTYAALNAQASALATKLIDHGVEPGDFVGLFAKRSPAMIVGLLAILKAGGAYVPLDPTYPAERLQHMIVDSGASLVVTTRTLQGSVPSEGVRTLCVEDDRRGSTIHSETATSYSAPIDPDQPAYVIYTSGSTGAPKGVIVTHANLLYSTRARGAYYAESPRAFLLLSPFGFDSSVAGIFWTLTTGGTLVLPRPGEEKEPRRIAALIRRWCVTHTLCVPALYGLILDHASRDQLTSLEVVIVAGEACPPVLPNRHHEALPGVGLFNEYGPTEATVWSTVHRVSAPASGPPVPIGRPIPGAVAYVLDRHQRVVPSGVPGELYIGGPGVTPGYLNRPKETAKRFLSLPLGPTGGTASDSPAPDVTDGTSALESQLSSDRPLNEHLYRTGDRVRADENGVLEFLGRIDHQVKLRGHRIEIEEIESVLRQIEEVKTGAVAVRPVGGTRQLVAYVVLVPAARSLEQMEGGGPSLGALRSALRKRLPEYMVPTHIEFVKTLPRTPNGKLDREALPTPTRRQMVEDDNRVAPNDPMEMRMLSLWQDVLDQRPLSMTDNFFHLGGDSLLAVTLTARVEDAFGVPIVTSALFDHPTPQTLTEWLRSDVQTTTSPVPVRASGSRPPLFCVPGSGGYPVLFHKLATYLGADQPVYSFQPQGVDGRELPRTSIAAMADQHLGELKAAQPDGPYSLCGFSVGGLVAYEMARRLNDTGDEVIFLGLLDTRLNQMPWPQRWWTRLKDDIKYWIRRREALSHLRAGRVMPRRVRNTFPAKVHERAARRYTPPPYSGPVDLFAAVGTPEADADNVTAWNALIGGAFTVHEVAASHDLLMEPHVSEVAARMTERLTADRNEALAASG